MNQKLFTKKTKSVQELHNLLRRNAISKQRPKRKKKSNHPSKSFQALPKVLPTIPAIKENSEIHNFFSKSLTAYLNNKKPSKKVNLLFIDLMDSTRKQYIYISENPTRSSFLKHLSSSLPDLHNSLTSIKTKCAELKPHCYSSENFSSKMDEMMRHPFLHHCLILFDSLAFIQARSLQIFKQYTQAVIIYKTIKHYSHLPKQKPTLMKVYLNLARCFAAMDKPKIALLYAKRCLEVVYYLQDKKVEMRVYDLASQQFFHMGNLEKAKYFHERMVKMLPEPKNTPLRTLLLKKLEIRNEKSRIAAKSRKPRMNIIRFIKGEDLHRENEHRLYYSSSDDEELPMSLAIRELAVPVQKRNISRLKQIEEKTRANILFEKKKTDLSLPLISPREIKREFRRRSKMKKKIPLPRISLANSDNFLALRMLQHKSPNRNLDAFFFADTKKVIKFRAEKKHDVKSVPFAKEAKQILKLVSELGWVLGEADKLVEGFSRYLESIVIT